MLILFSSLLYIYIPGDELEIHILEDTLSTNDNSSLQESERNPSDTINNSTHSDNNNNGDDDDVVDVNYIKKVYDEKSNDGDDEMMMTSRKDDICGISGRKRYQLHKLFFSLPKH